MADHDVDVLARKVDEIGQKLDMLSATVDARFVDVDDYFAEQRQYTEYAFDKLRAEMRTGFQRMERLIDQKLDRFVELQSGINRDFDRRIRALERPRRRRKA